MFNRDRKKRILICPLDWGLGHASRVSRIIKCLSDRGHKIIIAGCGRSLALLKAEFPNNKSIHLPSPEIKYHRKIPAWRMILSTVPSLIINMIKEHRAVKTILLEYDIDIIISDARYGLWNTSIPSILVTHQLAIKLPAKSRFLERIIRNINRIAINRFTECWVPDYEDLPDLSGELSHFPSIPDNARFVGPLSRFEYSEAYTGKDHYYEIVAVISGPEPQRSVFEELLTRQLAGYGMKSLIVCGRPDTEEKIRVSDHCTVVSFLTGEDLARILVSARYVICRSGYSGIMDLASLKKTAFLVPTPGQTEQEFLADYLSENNMFPSCRQDDFDLDNAIAVLEEYNPRFREPDPDLLTEAILKLETTGNPGKST